MAFLCLLQWCKSRRFHTSLHRLFSNRFRNLSQTRLHTFVFALLAAWKSAGHPVGVDSYLEVTELIRHLPPDVPPERLKTLLAPLLTRDEAEQVAFYEVFTHTLQNIPGPPVQVAWWKRFRWWHWVVLLVAGAVAWWVITSPEPTSSPAVRHVTLQVGEGPLSFCIDSIDAATYRLPVIRNIEHAAVSSNLGACLTAKGIKPGVDTISITYKSLHTFSKDKTVPWVFTVVEVPKSLPNDTAAFAAFKSYTLAPAISGMKLQPGGWFSWSKSNVATSGLHKWIWLFAWAVVLLQIGLFRELLRAKKPEKTPETSVDKTSGEKFGNQQPPYTWQLQVPGVDRIAFEASVATLVQQLRRRSEGDSRVFDVPKSIRETVKTARATFLYRAPTQPDEYLLLIDIRARNDHRAQLFDLLYREFARQEVLIERFFYDGDLRLCWNEKHHKGVTLRELYHKFGTHRLLIVGGADGLISPITGQLERWAEDVFPQWQHRSLLITRHVAQWGRKEVALDTLFRIAPASLDGLLWLAATDAAPDDRDIDYWKHQPEAAIQPLNISEKLPDPVVFEILEAEFLDFANRQRDERMLQWLAACAVSPVMHWDATLFFGQLVDSHPQEPLVAVQNLQRLNRLPWFNEGLMPEKIRKVLLDWLATAHPELLRRVRTAWKELLEANLAALRAGARAQNQPPFEQSIAYEDLRMQLVVNELALDQLQDNLSPEARKPLEQELEQLSKIRHLDFVALALLKTARERVHAAQTTVATPEAETAALPVLRGWRWQLPLFALGALLVWLYNPDRAALCQDAGKAARYNSAHFRQAPANSSQSFSDEIPFTPDQLAGTFTYRDTAYCLGSPQQQWLFYTYLVCEMLDSLPGSVSWSLGGKDANPSGTFSGYAIPDEAFRFMREHRLDSAVFYRNVGAAYWNAGLRYRDINTDAACTYLNALERWPGRDSVLGAEERQLIGVWCFSDFQGQGNSPGAQPERGKMESKAANPSVSPVKKEPKKTIKRATHPPCAAPVVRQTAQGAGYVSFAWDPIDGATIYKIWYVIGNNKNSSWVYTTGSTSIEFSNLAQGTYNFYFQADCGESRSEVTTTVKVLTAQQQTGGAYSTSFDLYFDTSVPSNASYDKVYRSYYAREKEILSTGQKLAAVGYTDEISRFFEQDVKGGWDQLFKSSEMLYDQLNQGQKMEILLRADDPKWGKASVNSVQNYYTSFDGGIFRKYIETGQLTLRQELAGRPQRTTGGPYDLETLRSRKVTVRIQSAEMRSQKAN